VTESARWLVVVHPGRRDLYQHLLGQLEDLAFVEVILDRRRAERRRGQVGMVRERRRVDRRQPPAAKEREQWALFRYCLVPIDERRGTEPLDAGGLTPGASVAR
jgi:hypothetical protein